MFIEYRYSSGSLIFIFLSFFELSLALFKKGLKVIRFYFKVQNLNYDISNFFKLNLWNDSDKGGFFFNFCSFKFKFY